jgi:hypothetical protein
MMRVVSCCDGMMPISATRAFFAVPFCLAGTAFIVVTDLRRFFRLSRCGDNHEVGRNDAMFAGPRDLLLVVHTTAMVPAFVRRGATAGVVLARIGAGTVLANGPYDRNAADLKEDADQEKERNRLLMDVADRCSWEPNAHAENPPLSPKATERTAPVQTLARHNTLVSRCESIIRANFLNSGDKRAG